MRIKLLGLLLSFSLLLCGCTGNTAEKKNSEMRIYFEKFGKSAEMRIFL